MYSLLDLKLFTHQKCLLNHIDSLWVVPDPWKSRIFFPRGVMLGSLSPFMIDIIMLV